jgi:hypothetical protein
VYKVPKCVHHMNYLLFTLCRVIIPLVLYILVHCFSYSSVSESKTYLIIMHPLLNEWRFNMLDCNTLCYQWMETEFISLTCICFSMNRDLMCLIVTRMLISEWILNILIIIHLYISGLRLNVLENDTHFYQWMKCKRLSYHFPRMLL